MKVVISKEMLLKGIQTVQNVVASRSTLPILNNVLLEAKEGKLQFMATDLELGITCEVPVKIQEEGATTVPAKRFSEIVKELPDQEVVLQAKKNNTLTIECGRAFFKIMGLPREEFPKFPSFDTLEAVVLKQRLLKEMFTKTFFAVSRDETRYVLNGVYFILRGRGLAFVATDGRRLALIERDAGVGEKVERAMILPGKTVQELLRTLQEDGDVRLVFGENQILFEMDGIGLVSRLIEGDFPNYEQVIPKESREKLRVRREELLQATRRVSLLASQDSLAVKLDLSKNKLILSKNAPDVGEAKEELEVDYQGEPLTIGFNPSYLTDVLKNLDQETVEFELTGSDRPGVVRTADRYTYIVLPMQLT